MYKLIFCNLLIRTVLFILLDEICVLGKLQTYKLQPTKFYEKVTGGAFETGTDPVGRHKGKCLSRCF